jgi:hypothetical protein
MDSTGPGRAERGVAVVSLPEKAFAMAAELPEAGQEVLALRLLAESDAEDAFDRAVAASGDKPARLAAEALSEHRAGLTQELNPDRL